MEDGGILVENGNEGMRFIQDSIVNKKLMKLEDYKPVQKRKASTPEPEKELTLEDKTPKRLKSKLKGGKAIDISESPNKSIIKEFQDLYDWYSVEPSEKIRRDTYGRIITALKQYPQKIISGEQVKSIPGIGAKTVQKIQDIIDQNPDRKSAHIPEYVEVCKLFQSIYGVGASLAKEWYDQGYRNLDEIKPLLNPSQRKYFNELDDLNKKIPRKEVEELAKVIERACKDADGDCQVEIMGSYRRGAAYSSDIDILVYPNTKESLNDDFMNKVVANLGDFVVSTLRNSSTSTAESKNTLTYQGICALTPHGTRRRFDIWSAPKSQTGSYKLHLTGNVEFNRGLSLLAHEKNMTFSRHGSIKLILGLKKEGRCLSLGKSEQEILEMLGVEYKEPEDRNS